jgi:PAS domain S-box-containing protein
VVRRIDAPAHQPMNQHDPHAHRLELADAMPHIVWMQDSDGRLTYFNRLWTEYTGRTLAESLASGSAETVHPEDRPALVRLFGEARGRGEAVEATYRLRRAADGVYRWHLGRLAPVRGADGRVASFVGTAVDIDAQRRAADAQRFLAEASAVLGTSLDVHQTLRDIARLVVPHMADWCAIDLLNADGVIERLAVAHVDPSKVQLANDLWARQPPRPDDPYGVYQVVRTRHPEFFADISDALLAASAPDPEVLAILRSLGLRSSMCVPLVARDHALGALTLVSAESGRRYEAHDLAFAEEFSRRIAISLDNARLYGLATAARAAAEALAADLTEQSLAVGRSLLEMRAERDAALVRLAALVGPKA